MREHVIVQCTFDRHANAILEIFNEAILNSTALYDYARRRAWFRGSRPSATDAFQ